jgi:acyl carrier protein
MGCIPDAAYPINQTSLRNDQGECEMTGAIENGSLPAAATSSALVLARTSTEPSDGSETRIAAVVRALLKEHSIERTFCPQDDLREVGLTSLDMASLILSVEAEFDLMIPERDITPANFQTVSTITNLVTRLLRGSEALTAAA